MEIKLMSLKGRDGSPGPLLAVTSAFLTNTVRVALWSSLKVLEHAGPYTASVKNYPSGKIWLGLTDRTREFED